AKINAAGAGVTATYDLGRDKLEITPNTPGASLVLDQDTSGFLAAMKIDLGATGTTANANASFDGSGSSAPMLDSAVTAGSFTVNGVAIDVAANDSIASVLAKITNSSAGVTATLSNDRVALTTKSASDQDIRLENDTSGFLAAMKLDQSVTARGQMQDTSK